MAGSPTALAKPVKMAWPGGPGRDVVSGWLCSAAQGSAAVARHQQHIAAGEQGIAPVLQRVDLDQDSKSALPPAAGRRSAAVVGRAACRARGE